MHAYMHAAQRSYLCTPITHSPYSTTFNQSCTLKQMSLCNDHTNCATKFTQHRLGQCSIPISPILNRPLVFTPKRLVTYTLNYHLNLAPILNCCKHLPQALACSLSSCSCRSDHSSDDRLQHRPAMSSKPARFIQQANANKQPQDRTQTRCSRRGNAYMHSTVHSKQKSTQKRVTKTTRRIQHLTNMQQRLIYLITGWHSKLIITLRFSPMSSLVLEMQSAHGHSNWSSPKLAHWY